MLTKTIEQHCTISKVTKLHETYAQNVEVQKEHPEEHIEADDMTRLERTERMKVR